MKPAEFPVDEITNAPRNALFTWYVNCSRVREVDWGYAMVLSALFLGFIILGLFLSMLSWQPKA